MRTAHQLSLSFWTQLDPGQVSSAETSPKSSAANPGRFCSARAKVRRSNASHKCWPDGCSLSVTGNCTEQSACQVTWLGVWLWCTTRQFRRGVSAPCTSLEKDTRDLETALSATSCVPHQPRLHLQFVAPHIPQQWLRRGEAGPSVPV